MSPATGGYPYGMSNHDSDHGSSRPTLLRREDRSRHPGTATADPADDPRPDGPPPSVAPVTDPSDTGVPTTDAPTMDPRPTGSAQADGADAPRPGATSSWLGWGAFSGLVAGVAFLAITTWHAASTGQGTAAPLRTIATLVEGPPSTEAVPGLGVVVHVVLSALFGLVFATLLLPLRRRSAGWLTWAGLAFGGVVYLVDFQLIAPSAGWFAAFQDANQPFMLAAHLVFGSVLAALLLLAKPRTAPRRSH